jgi:hypothetical protein
MNMKACQWCHFVVFELASAKCRAFNAVRTSDCTQLNVWNRIRNCASNFAKARSLVLSLLRRPYITVPCIVCNKLIT